MSYRPRLAEKWTEQWEQVVELIKDLGPEKSLDKLNGESAETSQKFLSVEDNTKEFDGIRVVSAFSREVRTVQDLIEYHEIDTEIWEPDRVVANQWNQGSKGPDNKIVRVQLHQIKATFVKKLNVINAEIRKYIEQRQKETPIVVTSKDHEFQRYIVIGCVHRPFHDTKIWNALMNYIRDNRKRINGIVINGDYLDMKSLSSHDEKKRMPEGFDLGFEYEDGYAGLIDIKNAFGSNYKDAFKAFNFGNHCERWFRHIGTNENSRYGRALQSPMDALDLEGLGYDVQLDWRSGYVQLGPKLQVFHGKYLGDTACKKHLDNSEGQSMIFNHTHAISAFYMGSRVAYNIGWMGDENSPGFAYADRFMINKWQKGFAIVDVDSNGEHYVNQIKCHSSGGFIADGKAY